MNIQITSKLPNIGTTIFTVMSQLANEHKAVNLSQGFPDYPIDPELLRLTHHYHNEGFHQYAPMIGIEPLRNKISSMYQDLYQVKYDIDNEVLVTNGASEAIFSTIAAFIKQGDEAIIFEPAYDLYNPTVQLFGGIVKPIATYAPNFEIDWPKVKETINEQTKIIIINNPNNPSCKLWSKQDFFELETLLTQYPQVIIIADEVYAHITLNDSVFTSIATFPELKSRSVITASFGKLLHTTGWKIGYCLAPQAIMKEIRKVHQFNVFTVNHALQHAVAAYLKNATTYLGLSNFFQPKYDLLANGLADIGFQIIPSEATYFLLADYSNFSNKSDVDFSRYLIEQYKVASIPVSAFYEEGYDGKILRFCFAKQDATLSQAIHNLKGLQ